MNLGKELLKETEVARLLNCHVQSLRNSRFSGKGLPFYKIGKSVRYDPADIERYLQDHRIEPEKDQFVS